MELKIINEKENPLFNRKEIEATIKKETSPKREEIAKMLSEKYSTPADSLRILDIKGKFGAKEFKIRANIYPSSKERNDVERLSKKEKEAETKTTEPKKESVEKPIEEPKTPAKPEGNADVKTPAESQEVSADVKTPAEEAIGLNPVEEAKKIEDKKSEEDKKEKDKSKEEKFNE